MRFGRADLGIADKMGGAPLERWSLAARAWIEAAFVHLLPKSPKASGYFACIAPFMLYFNISKEISCICVVHFGFSAESIYSSTITYV